jgi:F-type H+-transporting ATPase subunit b
MTQLFTQFAAAESSGIGALGFSLEALLIQLVTFLLAFLILRKFAFEPIGKILRERRELIENGVKLGEDMQKERVELDKKVADELRQARLKADGIVADAHDASRATVSEAEAKARAKADAIVAEAHVRGEQDTKQMRKQLEKELVVLVSEATEAIIDEKVDATKDAALIDKALRGRRAT